MSSSLIEGTQVGPYRLKDKLGSGGFSEVWRARREGDAHDVALKIVTDPQHAAHIRTETAVREAVRDPGVVPVLAHDWQHEPPYVALELKSGGDLRSRLEKAGGTLPWPEALAIFRAVARTLGRVHAAGIVHGDMKPENVLFEGDTPFLADFALSRNLAVETTALALSRSVADERIAGTVPYMAPEVRAGAQPTPAADVFACGLLLYEMLAGTRPEGKFPPPTRVRVGLPGFVDEVVLGALEPDAGKRFQDAGALEARCEAGRAQALAEIRAELALPLRAIVPAVLGSTAAIAAFVAVNVGPRGLGVPALVGGGVLGVVMGAGLVWAVARTSRSGAAALERVRGSLEAMKL